MKKEEINLKDGSVLTLPQPECFMDCMELIRSDFYRCTGRVYSNRKIFKRALFKPLKFPLIWFRLAQVKHFLTPLARFLYAKSSKLNKLDIPLSTRIGYGFYIGHGICIVINRGTIIGNNVGVSQFLNIGTNHETPAIIADNVYLAPMVCVVEDVLISSGATIGAGAVVVKDVPKNCVAVGVPAKVVHEKERNPWNYWPLK